MHPLFWNSDLRLSQENRRNEKQEDSGIPNFLRVFDECLPFFLLGFGGLVAATRMRFPIGFVEALPSFMGTERAGTLLGFPHQENDEGSHKQEGKDQHDDIDRSHEGHPIKPMRPPIRPMKEAIRNVH